MEKNTEKTTFKRVKRSEKKVEMHLYVPMAWSLPNSRHVPDPEPLINSSCALLELRYQTLLSISIKSHILLFWIGKVTHEHCKFTERNLYPQFLSCRAILILLTRVLPVLANDFIQLKFLGKIAPMNIFIKPIKSHHILLG